MQYAGGAPSHDTVTSVLVDFGIAEAALADALCPTVDALHPPLAALRRGAVAIGHALACSWRGSRNDAGRWLRRAAVGLERVAAMRLPHTISLRVPEGFSQYAVHPECYVIAAERFALDRAPARAICLGLRSIGAPLSGIVAAALERLGWDMAVHTVRPRGDPFDRTPALAPELARQVGEAPWCLIVDEGPGLSGSSFAGMAALALELGVPAERIVLFPSWATDGASLQSSLARQLWPMLAKYTVDASALNVAGWLGAAAGGGVVEDLSAGRWRSRVLPPPRWPPVQPQHERPKYLVRGRTEALFRFAGLGRFGTSSMLRAEWLAAAGFAPRPLGLALGYLATEWIDPHPDVRLTLERVARYLALLGAQPGVPPGLAPDELIGLVTHNTRESLGPRWAERAERALRARAGALDSPAVAHDGRMHPHEWVFGPAGALKTDGLDHHDDHFFPGPANIAWDLAGAAVECGLAAGECTTLLDRYTAYSGDHDAARRLPAYRVAYLATRLGYATLAGQTLGGTADGRRFDALARRYRHELRSAIIALPSARSGRTTVGAYDLLIFDADDTLRRTLVPGQPCPYAAEEWELIPGVRKRLARALARRPDLRLGIASNQDRVAFGEIGDAAARALLHVLAREAFGRELPSEAVQLCPHAPEAGCGCRKPGGAMLERIMAYYGVAPSRTLFVGIADSDRGAAAAAGTAFAAASEYFSSSVGSSRRRNRRMHRETAVDSYGAAARRATPA